jgi:hypothetical protein
MLSKLPYFCNKINKFHIQHSFAQKWIIISVLKYNVVSQRFNDDNTIVEQTCVNIKKNQTFNFYCRNMVIFSKFLILWCLGLLISGTLAQNSKMFTISIYHHICPLFHAKNNLSKLQINCTHFIGPILNLGGPISFLVFTSLKSHKRNLSKCAYFTIRYYHGILEKKLTLNLFSLQSFSTHSPSTVYTTYL